MPRVSRILPASAVGLLCATLAAFAVPPPEPGKGPDKGKEKKPAPAKRDVEDALDQVKLQEGLSLEVWAAEPLLANPVSFAFDGKGRCFVAETTRFGNGVPDTRSFMYWLDDDLACRTVADRLAMYKKAYPGHKPYAGFEKYSDQVRQVWDSTGRGRADQSSIFAGGFNQPADGLAAGVLARKGSVYLACIPDLYKLTDTKGANAADKKETLSTGYGVRAQFLGHDLHGLRMGPDGKLYFSIGDRGFSVKTKEGATLSNPDSGAVLRCDPDGAHLEIVHTGLRNPQELAFDDFGNLFTYDNNSDSGDKARWVQVVEGGDSGWRCGYQYGSGYHTPAVKEGNRGPWNTEGIWHVPGKDGGPPAYVVPPLLHFGNGPAGLTHYPGVGLADRYKDHFFACDFTSNPGNSVIWSLGVKPKGASFEVTDLHKFVQGMVPTDCEFGPDGAFYWSDWVGGWNPPNKGRIFKVTDPAAMKNPAVGEAKALFAEGFEKKTVDELAKLLEHPHQQVRLEAQYELADVASGRRKPADSLAAFTKVAKESKNVVARLHGVWGLGMLGRIQDVVPDAFLPHLYRGLLADADAEVRVQAVKAYSRSLGATAGTVRPLLADPEPRVKFAAAIAYGQIGVKDGFNFPGSATYFYAPLFDLLKSNADKDAYLRHAAVRGLEAAARNPVDLWNAWTLAKDQYDTPAVRLGVLLALRRHGSDKCAAFLADADPRIVTEAARAVHDERIEAAYPALATFADKSGQVDAVAYRALSAAFKLGTPEQAARVAKFAARPGEPDHARAFALKLLADWTTPPRRDHVTGLSVSLPGRPADVAANALKPVVAAVFAGSDAVRSEAVKTVAKLGLTDVGPLLAGMVRDAGRPVGVRVEALYALAGLKDKAATELAAFALTATEPKLRAAGRVVRAKADPAAAATELPAVLADPAASVVEKQSALAALGGLTASEKADAALAGWLDKLNAGTVPPDLQLDVLEAAQARTANPKLKLFAPLGDKVRQYDDANRKAAVTTPLLRWQEALAGGDPDAGRAIFLTNNAVYCQRCHRLDGQGGDVGPALNGIAAAKEKDRAYLLEAVVFPSAKIAKGFETVNLSLADGRVVTGIVKAEDKKQIRLVTPENKEIVVAADDVEGRRTGPSAMPDDLHKKLSKRELRDVVAFLASLTEVPKP